MVAGHVLGIATCSFENLLQNCLMNGLMEGLSRSGYIFSHLSACGLGAGTSDFSRLDIELSQGVDLVCVLGAGTAMGPVCDHLTKRNVPFAVLGAKADKGRTGGVAAGALAADAVLAYLKTGVFPSGVAFGPAWSLACPRGAASGNMVIRGGSWASDPSACTLKARASYNHWIEDASLANDIGFRMCLTL